MMKNLASGHFLIPAANMTKIHRAFVQICLYGLLLSQPASMFGRKSFKGREFVLFLSRIPQLMPTDPASRASFYFAHQLGTCLLAAFVAGQAVTALVYHFILRNDVPPTAAPGMREVREKQEFPIDRRPGRSMQEATLVVAASLVLGTAATATATIALARGGAEGHFSGGTNNFTGGRLLGSGVERWFGVVGDGFHYGDGTATPKADATSLRPLATPVSATETG
jgi:hypothetical protein